jgi:hypothetical protein
LLVNSVCSDGTGEEDRHKRDEREKKRSGKIESSMSEWIHRIAIVGKGIELK